MSSSGQTWAHSPGQDTTEASPSCGFSCAPPVLSCSPTSSHNPHTSRSNRHMCSVACAPWGLKPGRTLPHNPCTCGRSFHLNHRWWCFDLTLWSYCEVWRCGASDVLELWNSFHNLDKDISSRLNGQTWDDVAGSAWNGGKSKKIDVLKEGDLKSDVCRTPKWRLEIWKYLLEKFFEHFPQCRPIPFSVILSTSSFSLKSSTGINSNRSKLKQKKVLGSFQKIVESFPCILYSRQW